MFELLGPENKVPLQDEWELFLSCLSSVTFSPVNVFMIFCLNREEIFLALLKLPKLHERQCCCLFFLKKGKPTGLCLPAVLLSHITPFILAVSSRVIEPLIIISSACLHIDLRFPQVNTKVTKETFNV